MVASSLFASVHMRGTEIQLLDSFFGWLLLKVIIGKLADTRSAATTIKPTTFGSDCQ
jgi:hypothetical protein